MVKPWKVAQLAQKDSPTMTVGEKTGVFLEAPVFLQEKTALKHVS